MKKTAKYYQENPKAKKKKAEYQSKFNKSEKQRKNRAELNRENRRRGTYGNGDGMDVSHKKDGSTILEKQTANRARNRGKK
jgi:hypothetical protein